MTFYMIGIGIAAIQETKLRDIFRTPSIPGYTFVDCCRLASDGGGGVTLFVHHSLPFTPIDCSFINDSRIELQGINVSSNDTDFAVFNVYIPPATSCPPRYNRISVLFLLLLTTAMLSYSAISMRITELGYHPSRTIVVKTSLALLEIVLFSF